MNETDLGALKTAFPTANSLLVVVPTSASLDRWAAGLGLYMALKEAGKSVIVASAGKPVVAQSSLVGIDQVTQKLGNKNLVISFEYIQDAIEKVSYNVEGKRFNLVIQPKEGSKPLDAANVAYNYEGSDAQIVFVVGAKSLAELGDLYLTEKKVFESAMVVNVDNQMGNAKYGQVNVVDPTAVSVSELTTGLIQSLGLKLSADSAGNLFQGLETATQKWQHPNLTAETFEAAAMLLRAGARQSAQPTLAQVEGAKQFSQVLKQLQTQSIDTSEEVPTETVTPAPDWLKPKIFRGSDEV